MWDDLFSVGIWVAGKVFDHLSEREREAQGRIHTEALVIIQKQQQRVAETVTSHYTARAEAIDRVLDYSHLSPAARRSLNACRDECRGTADRAARLQVRRLGPGPGSW